VTNGSCATPTVETPNLRPARTTAVDISLMITSAFGLRPQFARKYRTMEFGVLPYGATAIALPFI
jgi:hypothetical protein